MSKPILAIDLFSQANLRCPHQAHQALLDAGRMVEIHGANGSLELAAPHHEDVKALLRSEQLSPSLFEGSPDLIDYIAGTDSESVRWALPRAKAKEFPHTAKPLELPSDG